MSSLLLIIAPVLTTAIVGLIKKVPTYQSLADGSSLPLTRLLAAIISLLYVVGSLWINNTPIESVDLTTSIHSVLVAFVIFLGSQGVYFLSNPEFTIEKPTQ